MISLMQNNKRTAFELKVAACDAPTSGERLCTKADVYVNAVTEQHRFVTLIRGAQPQQIRAHEQVGGRASVCVQAGRQLANCLA